ncbi:uncharacterized protein (DUF885 family) [Kitasatospora sp. MAA19]|uniref:DUF885 domain-containing protein n=1 Tax=Kitasatospora sp. MAA19 TaxID=3035090 RepID=UPI00247533ED|nr:DUF885 domain-containing protein [Kitasatospora sp. MAA19]MDH6706574.1 uncharacterized protein (DUF885 family) [Kitasatospora sp. MAA19]
MRTRTSESGEEFGRLADDYWEFLLERDPLLRVRQGLPVEMLPGASLAEAEERARFAEGVLGRVRALEGVGSSGVDADTAAFLAGLAEQELRSHRCYWLTPAATPYRLFPLSQYVDAVLCPFRFAERPDVERYLSLLHELARVVGSIADKAAEQAVRGFRVPAPALAGARATVVGLRASVARRVEVDDDRLGGLGRADRGRLRDGVHRLVEVELAPAFDGLLAVLDDPAYLRDAPRSVGWAQYAGGEEAYREFVQTHSGGDTPPERLHELGREQCRELAERMGEVRTALGFPGPEEEFHERLRSEPRLYARSPEEVEARYRRYLDRLAPSLPRWFAALPAAPYGLARLDRALEAGMTFGYYQQPTAADPIGRYRYNGAGLERRSLLGAASLIYHELAPGHHFHLARQAEDRSLPQLRREVAEFGAFNEGWAEYAAGLGWEMGLYDDPWDAYGRLTQERFTAQRLVVDTGLNLGTMNLGQARDFMRANSTEADAQIASDLLRYSTDLPGQALSYRAGYLEFARLRERAEAGLGAGFEVRAFHEAVLGGGGLPFPALRRRVTRELGTPQ